jgi:acetylornithine deacetylase/succinyl-diaminopimelate desuccinylase-like protein
MRGEQQATPTSHGLRPLADPDTLALARSLQGEAPVAAALEHVERDDARTLREQRSITSVPAPPFGEGPRAAHMVELMADAGLGEATLDEVGNVVARYSVRGGEWRAPLVVSAHLDTVFADTTPVRLRDEGDRIVGPGISDDGRGLAALLALARALRVGGLAPARPLWLVATVGEEGPGDLRGVRHLFSADGCLAEGCAGFVSLDGAGLQRIVTSGLGCRRWRASVRGPGGHSWSDWGTPNPIHALGRAVAALVDIPLGTRPATTLTVSRWSGGTTINAIPREAWLEFEIRSEDPERLAEVERTATELLRQAIPDPPGSADGDGGARLGLELALVGARPAGSTPEGAPLVRAAAAATRALGAEPRLAASSTDANLPMSLAVPALTLGAGGEAGLIHTPDEWYRNVAGPAGIQRALLTLLLADRITPDE